MLLLFLYIFITVFVVVVVVAVAVAVAVAVVTIMVIIIYTYGGHANCVSAAILPSCYSISYDYELLQMFLASRQILHEAPNKGHSTISMQNPMSIPYMTLSFSVLTVAHVTIGDCQGHCCRSCCGSIPIKTNFVGQIRMPT